MKHSIKITIILLAMFLVTQLIGIFVISQYDPVQKQVTDQQGNLVNITSYNLPYGMDPPQDVTPQGTLVSIIIAIGLAALLMLLLMKYKAEIFLRLWFFAVVALALGITFNALILNFANSALIAFFVALPLAYAKVYKRNLIVHNLTELAIYPGIAAIFVPLLNVWTVVVLLIIISLYDMYAVWHAGFMQKMAQYQIQKLRLFTGFFVPYLGSKEKEMLTKAKKKKTKGRGQKVSVAILGGGDVVFPIILAGVVLRQLGIIPALIISLGATASLTWLFYISKKGKFYPAMPFISTGCFTALAIAYIVS